MSAASPLAVQGVAKRYGEQQVLSGIGFSLQPGEIFGLIGLNGAGKTTLIKIILNLTSATAGEVQLFGSSSSEARARAQLAYLPEKFQPSRYLTGLEYLSLSAAYYGAALSREEAEAWAEALDLDPRALSRRVGTYSKGMGQKLGLIGALSAPTPLLLLDEPMSGLDPRARAALKTALIRARAQGRTVFFSSHILSDIDELCDRIGVIHQGQLHYLGSPAAFKQEHGDASLERAFLGLIEA